MVTIEVDVTNYAANIIHASGLQCTDQSEYTMYFTTFVNKLLQFAKNTYYLHHEPNQGSLHSDHPLIKVPYYYHADTLMASYIST